MQPGAWFARTEGSPNAHRNILHNSLPFALQAGAADMKRLASDIWDGLRFQAGRTVLSTAAVCIGMTALTILLAVMGGLKAKSKALIEEMGANVFMIVPADEGSKDSQQLDTRHLGILQGSLKGASVAGIRKISIKIPGKDVSITVFAADAEYFSMHKWRLTAGRLPDLYDHAQANRVIVIPEHLAETMEWQPGKTVLIRNMPFTVTGITRRPGTALEQDYRDASFAPNDSTVFMPISCSSSLISEADYKAFKLSMIAVKTHDPSLMESTVAASRRLLQGNTDRKPFNWITPESVLQNVRHLQKIIGLTAGSVALLCLILGGTTLMSLMVANVRDRIPEIALRRALGATARNIASLFVAEACFVTVTASLAGMLIAFTSLSLAKAQFPIPLALNPATMLLPVAVSMLLGMVFSYLPARMATSITPAEALRND